MTLPKMTRALPWIAMYIYVLGMIKFSLPYFELATWLFLIAGTASLIKKTPALRWIILYLIVCSGYIYVAGTISLPLDCLAVLTGLAISILLFVFRHPKQRRGLESLASGYLLLVATAIFWLLSSAFDYYLDYRQQPLALKTERFQQLRSKSPWPNSRVGLALSGGGYRAAVMHAGVLDQLEHMGLTPTHISTVSGGSIIGGFYSLGGEPKDLLTAVRENRFHLKRRILDFPNPIHLMLKMPIPFTEVKLNPLSTYSRLDVQSRLLDHLLFAKKSLENTGNNGRPQLMVCATDLLHNTQIGIFKGGLIRRLASPPDIRDDFANGGRLGEADLVRASKEQCFQRERLSRLVAGSGAFPGAFDGLSVNCPIAPGSEIEENLLLVDGGIMDNSGATLLADAGIHEHAENWTVDFILVSDGAQLPVSLTETETTLAPGLSFVKQLGRSLDLVYSNSEARRYGLFDGKPPSVLLSIGSFIENEYFEGIFPSKHLETKTKSLVTSALNRVLIEQPDALGAIVASVPSKDPYKLQNDVLTAHDHIDPFGSRTGEKLVANWGLVTFLEQDWEECVRAFLRTTTLEDNLADGRADRIFRLGQYLVILNWPTIQERLDESEALHYTNAKGAHIASFSKGFPLRVSTGKPFSFPVVFSNTGPENAKDVSVVIAIPSGTTFLRSTEPAVLETYPGDEYLSVRKTRHVGACTPPVGTTLIVNCTVGDLAIGEWGAVKVSVIVTAPAGSILRENTIVRNSNPSRFESFGSSAATAVVTP
jgi:uncharacterized repeat protein (TIGR01451 family)